MLEGIRFSAAMAATSFARLEATALAYHRRVEGADGSDPLLGDLAPLLLGDAWAMIDAVRRLRRFTEYLQQGAENPALTRFREETQGVQDLRDTFQHLERRVPVLVDRSEPLMGCLGWVYVPDPEGRERHLTLVVPGMLRTGSTMGMEAVGLASAATKAVDQFVLSALEPQHGQAARTSGTARFAHPQAHVIAVSLTDTMQRVETVIRALEALLRPQFDGHEAGASDLFLETVLRFEKGGDDATVARARVART